VRGALEVIAQRLELGLTVTARERGTDQEVREGGVPGQARTTQVRSHRGAEADALASVTVVALPGDHLAECSRRGPEVGAGAVVLEADQQLIAGG
jgi:hypothetical protein